ncbi:ABC transporter permease [Sphingomonas sp. dw_22]|uniref:ABC transporter permease n=1 Tax=Sphingomonas sp. dw_22 TaxID=2721175 RepID=UPI001BD4126B|nr:ABC transporter permease [Sphingomonas sp. dw_22]
MSIRFSPRRVAALVTKEGAQILRDPSTFLIAFVLPMILLFLFGYAVSLDSSRTRIAVVLQDSSAPALRLAQAYQTSRYFEVTMARSIQPVRDKMVDGELRAIIVIPQDFGERFNQGRVPPIQIITDGSQPNTANFAASYGEGVRAQWAAAEGLERNPAAADVPISISARFWYNPELKSRYFLVPGSIANVMTMIGTLLTALVIAREWERGTMEAMMATPISMAEFIASKVIPYYLLALASMTLCTLIGVFIFGVPFRGSVFALFLIASAFLMPALGLGLFISSATKNQFVASQVALLSAFLPTFLLSGFIYEIGSMPWPIQALTYLVPARYLIPCLESVFLAGDQWALILPNIGIMLLFGAVFFLLSFRVTRRSLD